MLYFIPFRYDSSYDDLRDDNVAFIISIRFDFDAFVFPVVIELR